MARRDQKFRSYKQEWQRKRNIRMISLLFMVVIVIGCIFWLVKGAIERADTKEAIVQKPASTQKKSEQKADSPQKTPSISEREKEVYTFLQGPKSWKKKRIWSGEWGEKFYDGGSFGGFGCGLCCIANVYSTISPYACSPVDAYAFAKKHTDYAGGGAISWGYMRRALEKMGCSAEAAKKPDSYTAFQERIKALTCAIVLVSSNDSECYWKDTPGHYVTIFLYDEKKDTVFLADSGDPHHNRKRISLKKIYRSLKTGSDWQFMAVKGYQKENDIWKHKKAAGNWVKS